MGALQGLGTPSAYPSQPGPWSNPFYGSSFAQSPLGVPFGSHQGLAGSLASHPQQQILYPQQQILQSLQGVLQQLQIVPLQLQQLQQILPWQLQQLQQIIHLLAQQSPQIQTTGMPFFQSPSAWLPGTQTAQPQMFASHAGYVM
jgi:hypothetical protein